MLKGLNNCLTLHESLVFPELSKRHSLLSVNNSVARNQDHRCLNNKNDCDLYLHVYGVVIVEFYAKIPSHIYYYNNNSVYFCFQCNCTLSIDNKHMEFFRKSALVKFPIIK